MKKNVRGLVVLMVAFMFCTTFSLGLIFAERNFLSSTPVKSKDLSGVKVNAVSLCDVSGVMKMTAINYIADDFAELNETVSGKDTGGSPSRRGTYRFYIDTLSGEQWSGADKLKNLLKPDGNWHLTMYIPPIFSACSVYVRYQNKEYVGSIDRYNVEYYGSFSTPSEFDDSVTHKTATKPIFIDIPISSDPKYSKECIVTVHYEADNDNFAGISDKILIGEDLLVRSAVKGNGSLLLIGAIVGAATLMLFLFICVLKRSLTFVPQLIFATGIFFALFSVYLMTGLSNSPYFLMGIRKFSVGLMLLASTLYLPKKSGKIPVRTFACTISAAICALSFISPFITSVAAYSAVTAVYIALSLALVVVVFAFTVFAVAALGKSPWLLLNGIIAGFIVATALIHNQSHPFVTLSPTFWMCLIMLAITVVLGFREFISAEKHNRYLTANLAREVAKQTRNLQAVLSERDKILLYVSHDMKKAVVGMDGALSDLKQSLTQPELIAKADYIIEKNDDLKKDFTDLGKYNKQNYVAEQSEILDLCRIVCKVTDELRPDCEANGIVLTVTLPDKLDVYAKKIALESVILNLVLNAIEHSSCNRLDVSVIKRKDDCRIVIADNGVGITSDKNVFEPYVSGEVSENNSGLGLFLAKSAVESMHGELTYERNGGLTIFSATLPLA
ncbi:MAG: ATP-binding protein [Firmicutes bacterium]|nr:ATP-binding protein [Bacillota bacterium]MDY5531771.1 ATP-binding protein [Pumilibacteraceae bacterium]